MFYLLSVKIWRLPEKPEQRQRCCGPWGGSANSLLWTQIKSDITGKPIVVPSSDTATTLGAAILAGVGVGMYGSFEEAVGLTVKEKRRHEPNPEHREVYERNYQIYLELYGQLKGIMKKYRKR